MTDFDAGTMLRTAHSLAQQRQLTAAVAVLCEVVAKLPAHGPGWLMLAQLYIDLGDAANAEQAASRAVDLMPDQADGHYVLGRAHKGQGAVELATACYRRAIELNPRHVNALTSLAILERGAGHLEGAISLCRQALAIEPNHAAASINLQNALALREQIGAGRSAAGVVADASALARRRSAALALIRRGEYRNALAEIEALIAMAPDDAQLWLTAGMLGIDLGLTPDRLLRFFETAARLDPSSEMAVARARELHFAGGIPEPDTAAEVSARAGDRTEALWRGLFVPAIADSRECIVSVRQRFEQCLDALLEAPLRPQDLGREVRTGAYYLAYHGECDRILQLKVAQLTLRFRPDLEMRAAHCSAPRRRAGRLRIGFISRNLALHSIGRTTYGLVKKLDREQFESYVIRLMPSVDDQLTRKICAAADFEVTLDANLATARAQIAALELDVLFYQDPGLDPAAYALAFARLAPVQCTSFGHPDTTGIPNMDYFVSNDRYEPQDAAAHYSEQLFLLRDLPTLAYYYRPSRAESSADRGRFGLPETGTLYVCPQVLIKVHPDFDAIIGDILARDPGGFVVLIRGKFAGWTRRLRERLERTLGSLAGRVIFLPTLPWGAFLQLLALADVVLDTLHFNGMNSSLECLAMGTPVVTLPGGLQRGRHTQAMYRSMGIGECIATGAAAYVDIAVWLGTDRGAARELRARILERNPVLFENPAVAREFERFYAEASAAAWAERS